MIKYIQSFWRQKTPMEVIANELAMAHLSLLEAETAVDYATSIVIYNRTRILRLNEHLLTYANGVS
jgi:hypothetical protein